MACLATGDCGLVGLVRGRVRWLGRRRGCGRPAVTPRLDFAALRKAKAREYVIRFVFGGAVTVAAALVTARLGSIVGGLFLGFPAILPASLTLVKEARRTPAGG
jgi:hypothetical protein